MFVKALLQKVFGRGDVGVDAEGFDEAPCADVFMEASCFGFAEGEGYPAKVFGENPPKKVKSPKMVAKPLMPKSLAKAMLM